MNGSLAKISRDDLYNSEGSENSDTGDVILPEIEFEIVEVQPAIEENTDGNVGDKQGNEEEEEFDFPLFSFGGAPASSTKKEEETKENNEENRGRSPLSQPNLLRVSLRSPSPDFIDQSRPESYYFSRYSDKEKHQFAQVALTGDDVWALSKTPYNTMSKVIDLTEYNSKVEKELARIKKHRQVRPGKKKRSALNESRKKREKREAIQRKIEKEIKLKLKKERFQRRSASKGKKERYAKEITKNSKAKYRTE